MRIARLAALLLAGSGACAVETTEPVAGPSSVVSPRAIAVGDGFSCALDARGVAYCWGRNSQGQLGDSTTIDRDTPAPVAGDHVFTTIDAGYQTVCGVTTDAAILCWGAGASGQLGNGSTAATSPAPVSVTTTVAFRSVAVGGTFACGIATDSLAWCWGDNTLRSVGVLGTGDTISSAVPRLVFGGIAFTSLSAGALHVCGLDRGGVGYCWGANTSFQLANHPSALYVPGPGALETNLRFKSLAAGAKSTCGVAIDGTAHCWGTDEMGVLGLGFHIEGGQHRVHPAAVVGGRQYTSLDLSAEPTSFGATCGVGVDELAYCWGANIDGSLGVSSALPACATGDPLTSAVPCTDAPLRVSTSVRFREIATSGSHSCGVTTSDRLMCWGRNVSGELGDGTRSSRSVPAYVR